MKNVIFQREVICLAERRFLPYNSSHLKAYHSKICWEYDREYIHHFEFMKKYNKIYRQSPFKDSQRKNVKYYMETIDVP